ncbi:LANO_0G03400g1_1 [Lachancea nothofagi CBS 11611]|uniref:Ribokinase n=1 Tax=Lachancea nothofagi CBS 11611 TaxID=1266666 RepID=A0A1G4KFN8_9SACH|nr:LANO_0G03400g1_1 [Lachancea nothofagi CBS 11611]
MTSVLVCGSLNYDLVTFTKRVPDAGETISARNFETHGGGKGLNQCVAISRLLPENTATEVKMLGHVGGDSFGVELKKILEDSGVDTSMVKTLDGINTGVATILVEQESGQNRILISEGANGFTKFSEPELDELFPRSSESESTGGDFVVFQNEIPGTIPIMQWIKENRPGLRIAYNPSPFREISKTDWALVDVLIVNEIEALQVLQSALNQRQLAAYEKKINEDVVEAYKQIAGQLKTIINNNKSLGAVIITLGAKGSVFTSKASSEIYYAGAYKVSKVIDTTGAGDTFLGGVISQLCTNHTLENAVQFATKASSLSIQKSGAAESIPSYSEVQGLI